MININTHIAPILGTIKSTAVPETHAAAPLRLPETVEPFITISRQAGAGGHALAARLVERLNAREPYARPWQCFDRELVEKIAADHHISQELIASLEESSNSWLTEFFSGLAHSDSGQPSELRVFHEVCATVRALAQAGRVVMVGCGAGFIARGMPGGIHLRLVADLNYRVATIARLYNLTDPAQAMDKLRRIDASRQAFFKRYWPMRTLGPEEFAMTLNASAMSEEQMVGAVLGMLIAVPQPATAAEPVATRF